MNWSRQKEYMTGANGGYSTDPVKGTSELTDSNAFTGSSASTYAGDYQKSFQGGMIGTMLLGRPDYTNPGNLLHNNVGDRTLLDTIFENKIFIDASLRDYTKQPDPYKFTVKFNGTEPTIEKVSVTVDGDVYCYPVYLKGDTDIVFDRIFKNVRSVVVNTLIMPSHIEFTVEEDGSYTRTNNKLAKSAFKYLVLKINELRNERCFSNNKNLGSESFIMKMDDDLCINGQRWIPIHNTVAYPESYLKFIDRLNVDICNDRGERLFPKLDGKIHDFYGEYRKLIDTIKELQEMHSKDAKKKIDTLKPRLMSLKEIVRYLAPELHLTFMTVEPQIDTKPEYRY